MAIAPGYFSISIRDAKGLTRNVQIRASLLDSATLTADELSTLVLGVANRINGVIQGEITSASYTLANDLSTLGAATWADDQKADVEEGAEFLIRGAEGFKTRVRIPTFTEELLVPGTRIVNMAETDVANLVGLLQNTVVGFSTEVQFETLHGDANVIVYDAYEQFKKSPRRRR